MTEPGILAGTFTLGLLSGFGPCAAPRYALLALQVGSGPTVATLVVFAAGCLGGYLVIGFAGAGSVLAGPGSHIAYAVMATAMLVCGIRTLIADPIESCRNHAMTKAHATWTSAFLSGVGSSLVVSPCCTPVVFAVGIQAAQHEPMLALSTLAAFGAGHVLPLLVAAFASRSCLRGRWRLPEEATATVSGALLVAIGGLYGILA